MKFPDRVTAYHKLRSIPLPESDGFILDVIMLSEKHRRVAARCEEDIVVYDYQRNTKLALEARPFMLKAFQDTFQEQEKVKSQMIARIQELVQAVRRLEVGSWDSSDAQEDLGTAG